MATEQQNILITSGRQGQYIMHSHVGSIMQLQQNEIGA